MQTLSGENLFQSSGPSYEMPEPPLLDSDPGFNTTRNEQIAGFIEKLRSQRPFVLRDENPEAPPGNIRGFYDAKFISQCFDGTPSLGGLQAILAMAYFSARVGDDSTSSFLADAAFCVQALQLHNASAIEQKFNSFLEQQVAKRALWFLYSIEKPRCLAQGLLPLIHDDFVDYDPPSSANYSTSEVDWFAINARFARICSSIIKERLRCKLSRAPSRRGQGRASEYSASSAIKRLESLLEEWRDDLPFAGDFDAARSDEFAASTCSERRHRIKCLNKYWSAIIATHSGQARGVAQDGGAGVRLSRARCIDAAQAILQNSHYITSTDILSDMYVRSGRPSVSLSTA
ncbi:fumonisin biosynthetic Zn(II)2Cys6 transcription factor Fum21 [Fusarium coicis]|nr:fumonisin biosynthetic Zn(II)2Cys6 transcription factor Fum21 [Fusarium coicis]